METSRYHNRIYQKPFAQSKYLDVFCRTRIDKSIAMIKPCHKLLDVGCWDGYIMEKIIKMKKAKDVVGVDNSKSAITMCVRKGLKAKLVNSVDKKLPFKNNQFDAVFAGEIIEHLFDVNTFLNEVNRILKPNGQFIITTPNLASLGSRLSLLFGIIPWMIENELKPDSVGHLRYFTFAVLEELLKQRHFKIIQRNCNVIHLSKKFYIDFNSITKRFFFLGGIIIISSIKIK